MNISTPYDWIREIPEALKLLDDIPLLGYPSPFPYADYAAKLGQILQIPSLSIAASEPQWRTAEDLLKGLPEDLTAINIALPPIEGNVSLVFSRQDINAILSEMIKAVPTAAMDADYLNAFIQYMSLEALNLFQTIGYDKNINPHLLSSKELPHEASLCREITVTTPSRTLHGRMALSQTFRTKWKERFAQRSMTVPPAITQKIEVPLHIEAGSTHMTLGQWRGVSPGDFVILDKCSLSTDEEKAKVMLTLNGKPVFRARLKQGSLKILEFPMFYEVETPMAKYNPDEEEEEVEGEEEESTEEEEITSTDIEEEATDEEIEEEEVPEEEKVEESRIIPKLPGQPLQPGKPSLKGAEPARSTESRAAPTPEEIPVTLVVEVGRFQISVQKLMELQPGNLLELDVRPENGIDLVINGKCVGKGELLKIGESLGVRILDII